MDKRIEGTFVDYQRILGKINDKLEEGYTTEQLLVITREEDGRKLKEDTAVQVKITSDHDDSLWDKIVSFFTVGTDDDDETEKQTDEDEEALFEDYGIDSDTYERFEEALDNGEYLLLIDDAPPRHVEYSDFMVRDGIINEEENIMDNEEKKHVQPDWVNTENDNNGDVESHSKEAEKNRAHDPITEEHKGHDEEPSKLQVDENVSHPAIDESMDRVSKDPFGMETEVVEKGEGGKNTEPEYDETGENPPAL